MLFQLQSETAEVSKARQVLLTLRDGAQTESLGAKDFDEMKRQIIENKEVLKNSIAYIRKNRTNINEKTLESLNEKLLINQTGSSVDPIQHLLALHRNELAQAYDSLIQALNQRELLIKDRIKTQVEHFGKEERILFENKNWSKELEDLKGFDKAFGDSEGVAEDYISLNEQVTNVQGIRNDTAEDRF